jgi:hypothetical protein
VFSSPVPRTFCADHGEHVPYHALRPAAALVPYAVAGEEERALAEGYNGLSIAGGAPLSHGGRLVDVHGVRARRDLALQWPAHRHARRYARAQCSDQQMSEVMYAHHCALEGPDADVQAFAVSQFLGGFE